MSEVKVRWIQRAAGRDEGHEEIVELTPFVQGCADNNRLEIVEHIKPLLLDPTPNEPSRIPRQRHVASQE